MSTNFKIERQYPLSETHETHFRPFTKTGKFTVKPSSLYGFGEVSVEVDIYKEKDPCSFLEIFRRFSRAEISVSPYIKCTPHKESNTANLEIAFPKGEALAFSSVVSATVRRRYINPYHPAFHVSMDFRQRDGHWYMMEITPPSQKLFQKLLSGGEERQYLVEKHFTEDIP